MFHYFLEQTYQHSLDLYSPTVITHRSLKLFLSLIRLTLMEMMVSTTYMRPHEFTVLSPNIDVFCVKIQLSMIRHTFTFAGDHIVSDF